MGGSDPMDPTVDYATDLVILMICWNFSTPCLRSVLDQSKNHPPWFCENLINLRNWKNNAKKLAFIGACDDLKLLFKWLKREFKFNHDSTYKEYISFLENNLNNFTFDPKVNWFFVNVKRKWHYHKSLLSLDGYLTSG